MEPPHVMLGSEEECHSNESGWTMYIGSPKDDDEAHCDDHDDENNGGDSFDYDYEGGQGDDPDVESDDSMASDASSGPSQYGMINPLGRSSGGFGGFTDFQQKVDCGKNKYYSDYKREASKSKGNQLVEENERVFIKGKGKDPVIQNGSKVKENKNHRVGTRK